MYVYDCLRPLIGPLITIHAKTIKQIEGEIIIGYSDFVLLKILCYFIGKLLLLKNIL